MRTQLIFMDGLPGSGKSESARGLAKSLSAQPRIVKLFEETDPTNPLHTAALDPMGAAFANVHLTFNVEGFAHQSLQKYRDLSFSLKQDTATIFESFPIQSHVRVLLQMDAPAAAIQDFWGAIQTALEPLQPALIYFEENDPVPALERILAHRGEKWADYIIAVLEQSLYATNRGLKGKEGIIRLMCDYNEVANRLAASWRFDQLVLPARPTDYGLRDQQILAWVGS